MFNLEAEGTGAIFAAASISGSDYDNLTDVTKGVQTTVYAIEDNGQQSVVGMDTGQYTYQTGSNIGWLTAPSSYATCSPGDCTYGIPLTGQIGRYAYRMQPYHDTPGNLYGITISIQYHGNTTNMEWIQHVTARGDQENLTNSLDQVPGSAGQYYDSNNRLGLPSGAFWDTPAVLGGQPGYFTANLQAVSMGQTIDTFTYGFSYANGQITMSPLRRTGP
jgi:hypothetical protein